MERPDISFASLIKEGFKRKIVEAQNQPNSERQIIMSKQIATLLLHAAERIPPTTPVTYTEHEGLYGILPKPAEAIVVRSALAGGTLPPIRRADEVDQQEPRRTTDKATIHLLLHIDPATATGKEKLRTITDIMRVLQTLNPEPNSLLSMPEGPPLEIKESELDLQILTTNGPRYQLLSKNFPFPFSAENALAYYQEAFMSSISQEDAKLGDETTGMFHSLAAIKEHLKPKEDPGEGIDIFITDLSNTTTSTKEYQPNAHAKELTRRLFKKTQAPRNHSEYIATQHILGKENPFMLLTEGEPMLFNMPQQ